MREIKFRGKRVDNGEWVYGDLVYKAFDGTSRNVPIGIRSEISLPVEIDPETVGQFTGLLDKNGKEINKGDLLGEVVKIDGEEIMSAIPVCWWEEVAAWAVDLSFEKDGSYLELLSQNYEGMEIIGTIFDNPELLNN